MLQRLALLLSVIAISACSMRPGQPPASSALNKDAYYAVLLTNGSVYFGKMEGLATALPVLTDVYYVQSNVNQETKAVSNILVKRGKEWHGPDRMIVNGSAIVFAEPVGPDSQVARLIAESKK